MSLQLHMPVKFAYLYCLSNKTINDLLKVGIINVSVADKRMLSEILKDALGDTWVFEMAKFIRNPQKTGETLLNILKIHYPVVERNIFNIPLEEATMYFDLIHGESVQLAHCKRPLFT